MVCTSGLRCCYTTTWNCSNKPRMDSISSGLLPAHQEMRSSSNNSAKHQAVLRSCSSRMRIAPQSIWACFTGLWIYPLPMRSPSYLNSLLLSTVSEGELLVVLHRVTARPGPRPPVAPSRSGHCVNLHKYRRQSSRSSPELTYKWT